MRALTPAKVRTLDGSRRPYLEALALLMLDEERHAVLFAPSPVQLRAAYLNVSEET